MKLSIAPHPSLFNGKIHRTLLEVDPNQTLHTILDNCRHLLSLWLFPLGGNEKSWVLSFEDGTLLNLDDTPGDLGFLDSQLIFVNLEDAIDDAQEEEDKTAFVEPPNAFEILSDGTIHTIPEKELMMFEQAKQSVMNRASDIYRNQGIRVSHRKIFHDEAVDDYDDDDLSELNYIDDVLSLKLPYNDS